LALEPEVEGDVAVPRSQAPLVRAADEAEKTRLPDGAATPVAVEVAPGMLLVAVMATMLELVTLNFVSVVATELSSRL
jgi:hypothetical protein